MTPLGPGPQAPFASALSDGATRVLRALVEIYSETGRATVRDVMRRAGFATTSTVHYHLHVLRRAGLVTWQPESRGTLRPLVRPVPFGEREQEVG